MNIYYILDTSKKFLDIGLKNDNVIRIILVSIIIYLSFIDKVKFIRKKYHIFSNEITKLVIIGICLYLLNKNLLIGIFFTMAYLITLNFSSYYGFLEYKNIEGFEDGNWCKKKKFIVSKKLIEDIVNLTEIIISTKNLKINKKILNLSNSIILNLDNKVIDCMPQNIKRNLKNIKSNLLKNN